MSEVKVDGNEKIYESMPEHLTEGSFENYDPKNSPDMDFDFSDMK